MKRFTNVSIEKIAKLLGISIDPRKAAITKLENQAHFLTSQIHLYLLLHFLADANTGLAENINIQDLCKKLDRNSKTIGYSLSLLQDEGFLEVVSIDAETTTIRLLNLSDMYKRRGEGGNGFITLNDNILTNLLATKQINELRTALVGLMVAAVQEQNRLTKNSHGMQLKIGELKCCFPSSIRPSDIRKSMEEESTFGLFFERTAVDRKRSIFVRLRSKFDGKIIKAQVREFAKETINEAVQTLQDLIADANANIEKQGIIGFPVFKDFLNANIDLSGHCGREGKQDTTLPALAITSSVKSDCVTIAQDYNAETVVEAIRIYYNDYVLTGTLKSDQKKSLGGFLRRIVEELTYKGRAAVFA